MAPSGKLNHNKCSSFSNLRRKYPKAASSAAEKYSNGSAPKKGSLKQQLRGQQRLLDKFCSATPLDQHTTDEFLQRKAVLETKIYTIERHMQQHRLKETERKNAVRYHKVKFFEWQKLTRMERKVRRSLQEATALHDVDQLSMLKEELKQVKLDQQYVKYFPNDTKYVSLFPDGVYYKTMEVLEEEVEAKRAAIRERVAVIVAGKVERGEALDEDNDSFKASGDGSTAKIRDSEKKKTNEKNSCLEIPLVVKEDKSGKQDAREKSGSDVDDMEQMKECEVRHDSSSSSDNDGSSSTSDDDSSSSTSDDDSISSGDSDGSVPEQQDAVATEANVAVSDSKAGAAESEAEDDDFFVDNEEVDPESLFKNAKNYMEGIRSAQGDKSKGWATQKQRPGEFKKRRVRR